MTYTYSDPTTVARDGLRLLCGDTDPGQVLLADEEYDFITTVWSAETNPYILAAYACETIAAKFAREIDISADSQSVSANVLQEKYLSLALRLRTLGLDTYPGEIYVGGIDPWVGNDPTVSPPAFGTQMHDNPAAGEQDLGDVSTGYWWFSSGPEFPWRP